MTVFVHRALVPGKSPGVVGFRELRPMVLGVSLPVLGWAIA
ncbi:hypothetical protein [Mycolicibacterium moriokaense]|nr:hypothetical protein [Mycolicibacterium moriokaense]